jgi:hypothetical protein
MPSVHSPDFPLLMVAAGMIAVLIAWALPRKDEWIGLVFVTAGILLVLASTILALTV